MPITIVTFNAGLLRAFGGLLEPAPFVSERRAAMPHALAEANADLVVLQEVYGGVNRHALASAFAYAASDPRGKSSLLALATAPIGGTFIPFANVPFEERFVGRRGILIVDRGDVAALTFHATAGGLRHHPESAAADAMRRREVEQLLVVADEQKAPLVIIAGDLNAGPGVSEGNYRQFEDGGWIDAFRSLHPESDAITWDPSNALNRNGPHRTSGPQRVDHVFVRQRDVAAIEAADIIFTEPIVSTPSGAVTLSDHYGMRVRLSSR